MRTFFVVIICLALLSMSQPLEAREVPGEAQVKAAYLYNFAKFIHWPEASFEDARSPLILGVLGEDPFAGQLQALETKRVRNRPIVVRYFQQVSDIKDCHLLYISEKAKGEVLSHLKALAGQAIVTVGEQRVLAQYGGVIQFVTVRDRLRFIINLRAAKVNHLQIDAQLLSLAIEVQEEK